MDLNTKTIEEISKTWKEIKSLIDERKSVSKEISEEKQKCSTKLGIKIKELNQIMKTIDTMEKGDFSMDHIEIAQAIRIGKAKPKSEQEETPETEAVE